MNMNQVLRPTDQPLVPVLETARLRLRPFRPDDFEDYATMFADPEVVRYLTMPFTQEQAWRHLAFLVGHWSLRGIGMWAAERRDTGEFVGRIGFADPHGWPGCELAWALRRCWWGRGYATEGARAALAHAFEVLKKDRVISLIVPENQASIRVAERLGQTPQGSAAIFGREHLIYAIDRETFERCQRGEAAPETKLSPCQLDVSGKAV